MAQLPNSNVHSSQESEKIPNPTLQVLQRKIAFSTIVQYGGKAVQMLLGVLTLKLISGYLSKTDYGVYGAIGEYALFFSVVANLGIFGNVVRKMADAPQDGKVFINALALRVATAVLFFISGVLVLVWKGSDVIFIGGASLFFGVLLFDYITSVCDGALQANYRMGRATFALVLGRILNFIFVYLMLKKGLFIGAETSPDFVVLLLFGVSLVGSFFTALLSLYFVYRTITWRWHWDNHFMLEVLKISLPFGLINISNSLYFRFIPDYLAYKNLTGAQFATFNISFKIAQVLSLFSTFLMFSVLPGLKEYIDQKHWHKVQQVYSRIWKFLLGSAVLLVAVGSWLGPFLLELLTHKKFFLPEFWFVFPLMVLLAAISYGYDLVLITLFAFEKDIWLLKRELIALSCALLIFGLSFFVGDIFWKVGLMIIGAIVGETVMVVLGMIKIKKELKRVLKPV